MAWNHDPKARDFPRSLERSAQRPRIGLTAAASLLFAAAVDGGGHRRRVA